MVLFCAPYTLGQHQGIEAIRERQRRQSEERRVADDQAKGSYQEERSKKKRWEGADKPLEAGQGRESVEVVQRATERKG